MVGKNSDTITTPHERHVVFGDGWHQRQDRRLNARLIWRFLVRRVADAARTSAHNDPGISSEVEKLRQPFFIQSDAVGVRCSQSGLLEYRKILAVRGFVFGSQLQYQERFHLVEVPDVFAQVNGGSTRIVRRYHWPSHLRHPVGPR